MYDKAIGYIISKFSVIGNFLQFLDVWTVFQFLFQGRNWTGSWYRTFRKYLLYQKTLKSVKL